MNNSEQATINAALDDYKAYSMTEEESRTWYLASTKKGSGSFGSFSVTWAPDILSLTGDMGDIVISRGNLTHWGKAVVWLRSNRNADYILSKTGQKKSYCGKATIDYLVGLADKSLLDAMLTLRDELRAWRNGGCIGAKPSYEKFDYTSGSEITEYADGWTNLRAVFCEHDQCGEVTISATRREIKRRMGWLLGGGLDEDIMSTFEDLGYESDFRGIERWTGLQLAQLAGLFFWADKMAETDEFKAYIISAESVK